MKIEIEIPDRDEVKGKIIETATEKLLYGTYTDESGPAGAMRSEIVSAVAKALKEKLDTEVSKMVQDTLAGTVQPTNEFGEKAGQPISLRERIATMVREWFEERVDNFGRPVSRASYEYGRAPTRAQHEVNRAVAEICGKTLTDAIAATVRELKAQVGDKVARTTTEAVKRLLNIPV